MSGGHFNSNRYVFYEVDSFADELELEILNNSKPDEWGGCPNFDEQTLQRLRACVPQIRQAAKLMKEIDWLYSGDHGEDSFLRKLDQIEGRPAGDPLGPGASKWYECARCDAGYADQQCTCDCEEDLAEDDEEDDEDD